MRSCWRRQLYFWFLSRFSYLFILLLLRGDTEICPGRQNTLSDFCNGRGFKIDRQNVRGILSNHHLSESESKIDIICVSNTLVKDGDICRSSRPEVFCKKGVLKNFGKFTGKHLYQRLFSYKVAGLRVATLLKKRLWHRYFPVNFVNFLRTPFFIEHLWWLNLYLRQ